MMFKDKKLIEKLTEIAQKVLSGVAGDELTVMNHASLSLDHFGTHSAILTDGQKAILDRFVDGDEVASFPYRPGRRIVALVGLVSRSGPEANKLKLGRQRAQAVYDYLKSRLPEEDLVHNISSLHLSRPLSGAESSSSIHGENRTVAVVWEVPIQKISFTGTPAQTQAPPPPMSEQWEIRILFNGEIANSLPIILGGQVFTGELKNVRTGKVREIKIILAGVSASLDLAIPIKYKEVIDLGVSLAFNETPNWYPFVTHWCDWSDFDMSPVMYFSADKSNEFVNTSNSAFALMDVYATVQPDTVMATTTYVGAGIHYQAGILSVGDEVMAP